MPSTYLEKLEELERAVLSVSASLGSERRRHILERARGRQPEDRRSALAAWMLALTDAVVKDPVTANVDQYLDGGRSEAEIFEVVVVAAVGAALGRADKVLPAIQEAQ